MTDELIILTDDDFEPEEGEKGWNSPIRRIAGKFREVKVDPVIVEAKMSGFVRSVGQIFRQANAEVKDSGLQLQEIELSVKISAKGEVKLIAGGETGMEGGITLKFKRSQSQG